jgi:hypothetical protein
MKKEVSKTMTASSDRWVPPIISRTGIRTGLAGSWAAAEVSLSPLFFVFHVFFYFLFSALCFLFEFSIILQNSDSKNSSEIQMTHL